MQKKLILNKILLFLYLILTVKKINKRKKINTKKNNKQEKTTFDTTDRKIYETRRYFLCFLTKMARNAPNKLHNMIHDAVL